MLTMTMLPRGLQLLLGLPLLFLGLRGVHAQPRITVQSGHQGLIRCLAMSADEQYLASAGADKTVIVWDVESKKKILAFTGHENWIVALEFGPSAEPWLLASGDYDGTVKIWNLKTARLEHEITVARPASVTSLAFSPTGEQLAIAAINKITIWNVKTRAVQAVSEDNAPITKVVYGKDNHVFSSSLDGTLGMWDLANAQEHAVDPREEYGIAAMAFDSAKELVALAYSNGNIRVRTPDEKEVELKESFPKPNIKQGVGFREFRLGGYVKTTLGSSAMTFLPDGRLAFTNGFTVSIWDYHANVTKKVAAIESPLGGSSIVYSVKRNTIFYDDGEDVKASDLNTNKTHNLGSNFSADFGAVSFALNGEILLAGGNRQALIMTIDGKESIPQYKAGAIAGIISELPVKFTEDRDLPAKNLMVDISGRNLILRKAPTRWRKGQAPGAVVRVLSGHQGNITTCWTDTWNNYLVSSGEDSRIILWEVETGKAIRTFDGNPRVVRFSDDAAYLAIAEDEVLKIWNLKDSKAPAVEIKVPIHRVLVFSPDNRYIATEIIGGTKADIVTPDSPQVGIDKYWAGGVETLNRRPRTLIIWDAKSGSQVKSLPMQTGRVINYASFASSKITLDPIMHNVFGTYDSYYGPSGPISFSTDGNLVAYDELDLFSGNSKVKVWNLSTNKEECVFEGHTSPIRRIIFSPDSKLVLSSGWDKTLRIWSLTSKGLKATILASAGHWVIFTPEGRFDTNLNLREANDVTWQWTQGSTRPLPLRVFLRDYYEPRLFRKILRDEPLKDLRDLSSLNFTQPKVAIRDVRPDGPDTVKVTVEVSDAQSDFQRGPQGSLLHSGVFDVRLLRNDQVVAQSTPDASVDEFIAQAKPLNATPDRFERELELWRRTHDVRLDTSGKATLTFEHIKLPKNSGKKEVDFTAYAFNSDRVTSELSTPFKYRLPALLPRVKPRAYVLTIGVDANESGWDLSFAAASADEVQKAIAAKVGKEYEVIKVSLLSTFAPESFRPALTQTKKENVHAVLDMLAGRPVSPERQRQLGNVNAVKAATPDDLVFIYIASHGFSDPQGNFFLIPYNSGRFYGLTESKLSECIAGKTKADSYNVCNDGKNFIANSISSNELANWLQGVDAGKMYMILDSCYSAAAPGSNFKPGPLGDRTFGQLAYDKGMTILTASQRSALSSLKLNGTLLSRTLTELMEKSPEASLLYLLEETEYKVPQKYKTDFPNDKTGIQHPVLLDFSETEN